MFDLKQLGDMAKIAGAAVPIPINRSRTVPIPLNFNRVEIGAAQTTIWEKK
jgi:hypothetical protein